MPRKKQGDCYEAAARLLLDWEMDGHLAELEGYNARVSLVHGEVFHPLPGWHGHAWVEVSEDIEIPFFNAPTLKGRTTTVFDYSNGRQLEMPAGAYYALGRVRNPKHYSWAAAKRLMLKNRVYGPWEDEVAEAEAQAQVAPDADQDEGHERSGGVARPCRTAAVAGVPEELPERGHRDQRRSSRAHDR